MNMTDIERVKRFASENDYPGETLDTINCFRRHSKTPKEDLESLDKATDDDWLGLIDEYEGNGINWKGEFSDVNGNSVTLGDKVMWNNPDPDDFDKWYENFKICTVDDISGDRISLKDEDGDTFDVTEDECTLVRKLDYKLYEDEKYHYGVCGMLQDIENARTMTSYIHDDDLRWKLDAACRWFKEHIEAEIANHIVENQ